jgi:hypothetical protein
MIMPHFDIIESQKINEFSNRANSRSAPAATHPEAARVGDG